MPEKPSKALAKRQPRHGLSSWVSSKKLPHGRAFQAVRRELSAMRNELLEARGGEENVTPEARILVDSIIEALGVQKILGLHVRKYGVLDAREAKRGRLELSPIMGKSWVSYGNMVRQGILALKEIDGRKPVGDAPTLAEVIREIDEAEAARAQDPGNGGPGAAQAGRSATDQGKDEGQGQGEGQGEGA